MSKTSNMYILNIFKTLLRRLDRYRKELFLEHILRNDDFLISFLRDFNEILQKVISSTMLSR